MRKFIALALFGCSGSQPLPTLPPTPQVPAELVCKLGILLNLPQDPEQIDYLAMKTLIDGVRGCAAVHSDAGP